MMSFRFSQSSIVFLFLFSGALLQIFGEVFTKWILKEKLFLNKRIFKERKLFALYQLSHNRFVFRDLQSNFLWHSFTSSVKQYVNLKALVINCLLQKRRLNRLQTLFGWDIHYVDSTESISCMPSGFFYVSFKKKFLLHVKILTSLYNDNHYIFQANQMKCGLHKWLDLLWKLLELSLVKMKDWCLIWRVWLAHRWIQLKEICGLNMYARYAILYLENASVSWGCVFLTIYQWGHGLQMKTYWQ